MSLPVSGSCTETIAPFLLAIVLWMKFDIVEREHKELREEVFAQVACHISVTFTSQNNSRLPLLSLHPLPPLCVFPTLCEWTVKETYSKTQCVCVFSKRGWMWTLFPLFGWAVYFEVVRKPQFVSLLHTGPGTRWRNIPDLLRFCGVRLRQWSWQDCQIKHDTMFNPVHAHIPIAGTFPFIIYNKVLTCKIFKVSKKAHKNRPFWQTIYSSQ